jgi:hypothetical protein
VSDTQESQKKIAIVMLACRDYKATELALASHMAYRSQGIPFYILQNCRGCYDAERTYDVASRYAKLFPNVIKVIDWIPPGMPYHSITELLKTPEFSEFDLILKSMMMHSLLHQTGWIECLKYGTLLIQRVLER